MKKWLFCLCAIACCLKCFSGEKIPPVVLDPLPAEYSDELRRFQGIPSLCATDDQNIWACWYAGGNGEDDYNYILVIHSKDGGETWTKPLFAIDQPGRPREYDPSMWLAPDGKLHLYWSQRPGYDGASADVWTISCENPNTNPVWEKTPRFVESGVMMNKPMVDSKGRWVFPISVWNVPGAAPKGFDRSANGPCGAWFVVSTDEGKTYQKLGRGYTPLDFTIFDEHSIVELKDGRFWLMNRTTKGIGDFYSADGGKTWTDFVPSKIPHTSSRTFLRRLQSGNLILVKNGPIDENVGRKQMMAFLSKDDGKTWEGGLMLDERNSVSYPDGDQAPNGTIYVVYDFDRCGEKEICVARITEEDILAGKIVSPKSRLGILANKAFGKLIFQRQDVKLRDNKDGKPFVSEPSATFRTVEKDDEITLFETGYKIFADRSYELNEVPDYLKGRKFLRGSIDKIHAVCEKDGMAYILMPQPDRNVDNCVEALKKAGFERVAKPEFILFGGRGNDAVTLFQKKVKAGETISFDKWGVLVF